MLKLNSEIKKVTPKKFDRSKASVAYQKTILVNQLDEAFKRFDGPFIFEYESKKSDFGWHPSGDCLPRVSVLWANAYSALHPDESVAVRKDLRHLNKIFMVGHYWHQIIQHIIVKEGWAQESSIESVGYRLWDNEGLSTTYWRPTNTPHDDPEDLRAFHYVRGQGDVAPLVMPTWNGLVDIKTMNADDFKRGLSQSRFANKYLAQINIYMDLFDLDQAMILAVDKGSSAFAEYTFVRDQKLIDQIYAKWQRVGTLLDNNQKPTPEDDEAFALYIGDE